MLVLGYIKIVIDAAVDKLFFLLIFKDQKISFLFVGFLTHSIHIWCGTSWLFTNCMYILLMLLGELEENMAELEESRRKLVSLKMQKDVASGMHLQTPGVVTANGNVSPEKSADRTMDMQELKESIEETKVSIMWCSLYLSQPCLYGLSKLVEDIIEQVPQVVAADRLSELEESQQDNINLSKQLQNLQVHWLELLVWVWFYFCLKYFF